MSLPKTQYFQCPKTQYFQCHTLLKMWGVLLGHNDLHLEVSLDFISWFHPFLLVAGIYALVCHWHFTRYVPTSAWEDGMVNQPSRENTAKVCASHRMGSIQGCWTVPYLRLEEASWTFHDISEWWEFRMPTLLVFITFQLTSPQFTWQCSFEVVWFIFDARSLGRWLQFIVDLLSFCHSYYSIQWK